MKAQNREFLTPILKRHKFSQSSYSASVFKKNHDDQHTPTAIITADGLMFWDSQERGVNVDLPCSEFDINFLLSKGVKAYQDSRERGIEMYRENKK